jgi:hypothetical protein
MFKYIAALLIIISGCSSDPTRPNRAPQGNPLEEGLVVDFQLTDERGNSTTEFAYGEDIYFAIKVVNHTGEDQPWSGAYYETPFGFCVYDTGIQPNFYLGSTADGSKFSCDPDSGVFDEGAILTHEANWFGWSGHTALPVGTYNACVRFSFLFDNICPDVEPIAFTVAPSSLANEHVFAFFRMPAMGFLPPEERFLWAHVVRSRFFGEERYVLVGERTIAWEWGTPECPGIPCPITVPITPLILDDAQDDLMLQLIDEFPTADPEINHACDPAYATWYRFGDKMRRVGTCVYGPPEYREHMNDLEQFLESLVPYEPQGEGSATPPRISVFATQ